MYHRIEKCCRHVWCPESRIVQIKGGKEKRGYTEDVDKIVKVISGLDSMMSDGQSNEVEKHWWEED